MEGIGGFFRYAEMRREGRSDEEILREMVRGAEVDLERRAERVDGILRGAFDARRADGGDLVHEMEEASDITGPARERIEAAKKSYNKAQNEILGIEEVLSGLQDQLTAARSRKELLSKKLRSLTGQLNSTTEEPKWMKPGTLEELRSRGRAYGDACSRR